MSFSIGQIPNKDVYDMQNISVIENLPHSKNSSNFAQMHENSAPSFNMNSSKMNSDAALHSENKCLPMCTIFNDDFGVLRAKAQPVDTFNDELQALLKDMIATMKVQNGIGLAAPQIGKSLKICVIDTSPCVGDSDVCTLDFKNVSDIKMLMPLCLVNPKIIESSKATCTFSEGCLSIPGFAANVKRPTSVMVKYFDKDGIKHALSCNGMLARCMQHEIDHLDGILYVDKISKADKKKFEKYKKIKSSLQPPLVI